MSWIAAAKKSAKKPAFTPLMPQIIVAGGKPLPKKALDQIKMQVKSGMMAAGTVHVQPEPKPILPDAVSITTAVQALKKKGFGFVSFETKVGHNQITRLELVMEFLPPNGKPLYDMQFVHELEKAITT